jgi:meckelin
LIDVPALIDNYVETGLYPNREFDDDPSRWKLVRRFFLYENVSSIIGDGEYLNPTGPPQYVRFLHESRIVYELDRGHDETMYIPYIHLFYRTIQSSQVTGPYGTPAVVVTQWKMDVSDAKNTLLAFLIVTHVFIAVWVVWKVYKWAVLHPQNLESTEFLFLIGRRVFYEIIQAWSDFIFWYLWIAVFVWFAFFKFEDAFYVLLPDNYEWKELYRTFHIIFGIMLCLKIIVMWAEIFYQCNVDVFFLDRERIKTDSKGSPNAWRLILVANEYNEMQNAQFISIEYTLLWFVFLMYGEGWENWSAQDPDFNDDIQDSLKNEYLKFCITVILLLAIGGIQYAMKRLFSFLFPLPMHNFIDLCSVTNISVFIFDQRIHGYYIHGESTGGQTDVSSRDLKNHLDNEERGESRIRGLVPEYPNLQTFEIYLPIKIRQIYELLYKQPVLNEISTFRQTYSSYKSSSRVFQLSALPKGLNIQALINQKNEVSQYFINYIAQLKNYPSVALKERGICQMFSDLPPDRVNQMETPLFLRDHWFRFKRVFFGALDFDLLILISCLYTVLDIWELNFMQSTLIVYTFYKVFIQLPREYFGSRNLSTKSLVESKFLL